MKWELRVRAACPRIHNGKVVTELAWELHIHGGSGKRTGYGRIWKDCCGALAENWYFIFDAGRRGGHLEQDAARIGCKQGSE